MYLSSPQRRSRSGAPAARPHQAVRHHPGRRIFQAARGGHPPRLRLQRSLDRGPQAGPHPHSAPHSAGARTTCGTRRSRCGSTPGRLPPRSPAAPGTASRSCSRSTPTASTGRLMPPTSASPTPSAPRTPGRSLVTREMTTVSQQPEWQAGPGPHGPGHGSLRPGDVHRREARQISGDGPATWLGSWSGGACLSVRWPQISAVTVLVSALADVL